MALPSWEDIINEPEQLPSWEDMVADTDDSLPVYRNQNPVPSYDELTSDIDTDKIGFFEAAVEHPERKVPFSPMGALDAADVALSARRIMSNDYEKPPIFSKLVTNEQLSAARQAGAWVAPMQGAPEKWSPELQRQTDIDVVFDYLQELDEKQQRGYSTLGRAGQIVSEMPAFAIEFILTGGLAASGKQGAKELAERILGRASTTTAGRATIAAAGFSTSAAFRAAGMPNRAAEAILRRQAPEDMEIIGDQVIIKKPGESPYTSLWKGLADHYIEVASEQAGEVMSPYVSKLFSKIPFVGKLTSKIKSSWLKKYPKKTPADFLKAIGTKTGFHGMIEEMGEEFLGDATRGLVGVDDFGAGPDANALERIAAAVSTDIDNIPAMLIGFGIPGLGRQVVSRHMAKKVQETEEYSKRFKDLVAEAYFQQFHQIPSESFLENALEQETLLGFEDDFFTEATDELRYKYNFKKPGPGKFFTPKWLLNRIMGIETMMKDVTDAEEAFQLEQQHLSAWTSRIIKKLKKEKALARLPQVLEEQIKEESTDFVPEQEYVEEMAEAAGGLIPTSFESVGPRTDAHILQKKIGDNSNPIEIMRDLLDTYENAPAFLNDSEANIFNQIRELTRSLRDRANMVRRHMGLDEINNVSGYITHWMDGIVKDIVNGELITEDPYLYKVMHELPKEVKNKTAYERKVKGELEKYFSKDLGKLLRIMTTYDLKDIYIKQPYEAAWEELNKYKPIMPKTVYDQARRFLEYDIRKIQALMDESFNALLQKPTDLINKLRPLHRAIHDPARGVFSFMRRIGILNGLGLRLKPSGRNLGQRLLLTDLYRTVDYGKAQAVAFRLARMPMVEHPITGEKVKLIDLIHEQDWYQLALRKFEDTMTVVTGIERTALAVYSRTHIGNLFLSNVEVAALTGYFDWKNMYEQSQDQKSKHFKNANKQAKKLGVPLDSLLTQKGDMMWHLREAVRRTQWEYFSTSMPVVYRSQFNRAMFMFQSWWMNYFFNHSREMINQTLTGRNSLGRLLTPGGRMRAVKGLGTIVAIGKAAKVLVGIEMAKFLITPFPTYLPPIPALILSIIEYLSTLIHGDEQRRKSAERTLKYNLKFWIPLSGFGRDLNKFLSGEWNIADLLIYRGQKEKEEE